MRVKLEICQACAAILRKILADRGRAVMCEAVGPTLQACPTCRTHLPPGFGRFVTREKKGMARPS
jgi:hypothetical protein